MLYLNFGDWDRAMEWFNKRGPGSYIITFDVEQGYLTDFLEAFAVHYSESKANPDAPHLVDTRFADKQYGLRSYLFPDLIRDTVPGSFKVAMTYEEWANLYLGDVEP
jgi:hypothetical protein